ncbi:hypothetical protein M5K25_002872 [Dendrobium thyrsiflorum]|uniref:Secreted protein n=1 Tax=Dendrobium thyrsiflorum TaxID=117978 RepID=A0ABD0VNF7_DENTH
MTSKLCAIATGVMWSFVGGAGKPSIMHVLHPSQLWISTGSLNYQGAGSTLTKIYKATLILSLYNRETLVIPRKIL